MGQSGGSAGLPERTRQLLLRHRRGVAAVLAALCVYCVISVLRPQPPATVMVATAAVDLPAGHALREGDVSLAPWPTSVPRPQVFTARDLAIGRITTGAMLAGEPIGPSRVIGPGLLNLGRSAGQTRALVAASVRLADAGEVALLKPGDLIDVLAARAGGVSEEATDGRPTGFARVVAERVRVIVVPDAAGNGEASLFGGQSRSTEGGLDSGSMVVLAVDPQTATALAAAATRSRLSAIVRSG